MSWIDEARLKITKHKTEEAAKSAEAAKAQLREIRVAKIKFAEDVKGLLPSGVELVTGFEEAPPFRMWLGHLYASVYPPDGWVRVHVGDGVQFDLVYVKLESGQIPAGMMPWGRYKYILVYKAGGPYGDHPLAEGQVHAGWEGSLAEKFSRDQMDQLLLKALEKKMQYEQAAEGLPMSQRLKAVY